MRLIKAQRCKLIHHRLSGLQAAILGVALRKDVPGARGADVSNAELIAEIWGWKPQARSATSRVLSLAQHGQAVGGLEKAHAHLVRVRHLGHRRRRHGPHAARRAHRSQLNADARSRCD